MRSVRAARCLSFLSCLTLLGTGAAAAQAPADRAALLAVRDSTIHLTTSDAVDELARPLQGRGSVRDALRIRNGLVRVRQGELSHLRDPFNDAADEFDRVMRVHKEWPLPWYGAGLAERGLAKSGLAVVPSSIHALGFDYNQSAVIAFTEALKTDSTFSPAADGVADALWATTRWGVAKVAVKGLRGSTGRSSPTLVLRAMAEREAGERDSVAPILRRALAVGGDSALILFELSREDFLNGAIEPGSTTYYTAVGLVRSPQALAWLKRNLAFVAAPTELDRFDRLNGTERTLAVRAFWTRRDVESAMPPGTRLREHFRRYEIARNSFRPVETGFTIVPRSQAGMMAHKVMLERCQEEEARLINARKSLSGLDSTSGVGGQSSLTPAGSLLFGPEDHAEELDVRGEAVMRYGEPDRWAGQFWRFNADGRNLVFRTNACDPGDVCNVDLRYCDPMPSRELFGQWMKEWKESWDTVRTTNRMVRSFAEALKPIGDAYGLLPTDGTNGRILITFAVPARQLNVDSVNGKLLYPIRLELIAAPLAGDFRIDHDTTRVFASSVALGKDDLLQGVEVLTIPPGSYRLRIVFETPDGRRGAVIANNSLLIPDPRAGHVVLSDLILGRDESKLTWWSGVDRVRLNPSGSVKRTEALYTYYQVSGLTPGAPYRTSLDLFEGIRTNVDPLLSLAFDETATEPSAELQRTLGLEQVGTGPHTLRVTIRDGRGDVVAQKSASIRIE